jgi:LacI family transcriptional regulator
VSERRRRAARSTTIVDVAARAGVSIGTVSNVLSGARHVSPATRSRVEAALRDLEFRPNRVARALSQRRTHAIGMVVPDVTNPFFATLILTAEQALAERGFAVLFGNAGNDADVERRYLAEFVERRVDGLVAATSGVSADVLAAVAEDVPTVLVDRTIDGWRGDTVAGDDRSGMSAAVEHLVELGHERIALLDGDHALSTGRARLVGARERLEQLGLVAASITSGPFTLESGFERALALLKADVPPTAICAANDLLAIGALRAAAARGVDVPGAVSVTGFDDIAFAAYTAPPLTTVRQRPRRIASAIVDVLTRRMENPGSSPTHVVVSAELVVRGSTARPRSQAP